jgi:hypothetical protein
MGLKSVITSELLESVLAYNSIQESFEVKNSEGKVVHTAFSQSAAEKKAAELTTEGNKHSVAFNRTAAVTEGTMHPAGATLLKHIKPEHHEKYKKFLQKGTFNGSYSDRASVLNAAKSAGHLISESVEEDDATPTGYSGSRHTPEEIENGKKRKKENERNEWAAKNGRKVQGNYGKAFDTNIEGDEIKPRAKVDPNRRRGRPSKAESNTGETFDSTGLAKVSWLNMGKTTLPKGKGRKITPMATGDKNELPEAVKMGGAELDGSADNARQFAKKGTGDTKVSAASKFYQMQTSISDEDINKLQATLGAGATNIPQHSKHGVSLCMQKEGYQYSYDISVAGNILKEGVGITESGILAEATRFMESVLAEAERIDSQSDRIKDIIRTAVNK